ncbi:NAD(+) diphosphatase [Euzebya tangerina]|uniref:NAD(+) diphosphatase n=1 Tax=Euzebya tangerina TaxID=591198 RepID=UPI0013C306BD|nr:NAD(+) diphosphatase [Euzebya tangerina]
MSSPASRTVLTRLTDGHVHVVDGSWDGNGRGPSADAGESVRSVGIAGPADLGTELDFAHPRGVLFERGDAHALLPAVALGQWWARTRFCPRCGRTLEADRDGRVLRCENGHQEFPRIEPAVIMRVTDVDDRVLLARQPSWMVGRFSILAGFVDPGEPLEAAVRREVAEEVGVKLGDVSYLKSQAWPFPSSLMLAFSATAITTDLTLEEEEIAEAAWFSRDDLAGAIASGDVALPPPLSVAYQLIRDWMGREIPDATVGWDGAR